MLSLDSNEGPVFKSGIIIGTSLSKLEIMEGFLKHWKLATVA